MKKNNLRYIIYFLCSIISFGVVTLVYALNTISTGFQTTATNVVINAHNDCQVVRHTATQSYFVPTKTDSEWQSFQTNKPADVIVATCPNGTPCGLSSQGKLYGGYCFYQGNMGQSCSTVCSTRGGVDTAGMSYSVSSSSICQNISIGFGNTSSSPISTGNFYSPGCGCLYWAVWSMGGVSTPTWNYGLHVLEGGTVNSSCSFHEYARYCACNN